MAVRCLAVLTVAVFGAACGSSGDAVAVVTTPDAGVAVKVSSSKITLNPGSSQTVTASVTGAASNGVTWTSSTPAIATVSQAGVVTGVTPGETSITATSTADPKKNASTVVLVVFRVNVSQTPGTSEIYVGGTLPGAAATTKLAATVTGDANTAVTWTSGNTAVATVDATGTVTAVSAGTATISSSAVADPTRGAASTITVFPAITSGTALTSGTPVTGLGTSSGSLVPFRIYVAPGTTSLVVGTAGGTGDVDLYVRRGTPITSEPTSFSQVTCGSAGANTVETCTIPNPPAGIYYILLVDYGYSGTTLTARTTP